MSDDDYPTGMSPEVLERHLADHPCRDHLVDDVGCPCDACVAFVCLTCRTPVLIAVDPSRPLCEHARALIPPRVRPLRRSRHRHRRRRP